MTARILLALILPGLLGGCVESPPKKQTGFMETTLSTESRSVPRPAPEFSSRTGVPTDRATRREETEPGGTISVYLIPLDDFSEDYAAQMGKQLSSELGIRIKGTLRMGTRGLEPFPGTQQFASEAMFDLAEPVLHRLPDKAADTTYVLLTNRDINSRTRNFRFQFSSHDSARRVSVISTARMKGDPNGYERLGARLLKMTKRAIGEMYFGWPRSSNIKDLMYAPIMSLDDLDHVGNAHDPVVPASHNLR